MLGAGAMSACFCQLAIQSRVPWALMPQPRKPEQDRGPHLPVPHRGTPGGPWGWTPPLRVTSAHQGWAPPLVLREPLLGPDTPFQCQDALIRARHPVLVSELSSQGQKPTGAGHPLLGPDSPPWVLTSVHSSLGAGEPSEAESGSLMSLGSNQAPEKSLSPAHPRYHQSPLQGWATCPAAAAVGGRGQSWAPGGSTSQG